METKKTQIKRKFVSLAEARPDLAKEWNYEKNGDLRPEDVSCGSNKKVWWIQYDKSPITGKIMKLEWNTKIIHRYNGAGNPIKSGHQALKNYNDLASVRPDLASEWSYERNGDLTPDMVTCGSGKKVWWITYKQSPISNKMMKLEWETTVAHRVNGTGECPYLVNKKALKGFNDLQSLRPDLASEWNYERNGDLKPDMVVCGSAKKVWWIQYDISPATGKKMKLEWQAEIRSRAVRGLGNPIKSGSKVLKDYNDLASLRPDLAAEWNYNKNGNLKPDMVTCGSNAKVWWIRQVKNLDTGKITTIEWQSKVTHRTKDMIMPNTSLQCMESEKSLLSVRPDLALEWNYKKNGNLKPQNVSYGSSKNVWWIQYDKKPITGEIMKFEWKDSIIHRVNGRNNPFKNSRKILKGYNDLASVRPDLALEWNYERNGKLKPDEVSYGSGKQVWWIQYDTNPITGEKIKLEWKASIDNRVKGRGNPIKTNKKVLKGYNDLATLHPDLASEWNYDKNGDLKPQMVACGCVKKVWWVQFAENPETGKIMKYEWKAQIKSRVSGVGNPFLITYKGEEYVKKYLQKNDVTYISQQKFSDLLGTGDGKLSYDFAIPDAKNRFILIEYNGIQHYESCEFFGGEEQFKKQQEHDRRKREYAKQHGYKLITIKYTYDTYEKVAEYLDKHLPKRDCKKIPKKAA